MSTEKKEVAKTATLPKSAETKKEPATTTAGENKKIVSITELLDKQLADIKRKKELADRRTIFLTKSGEVAECLRELQDEETAGVFTSDNYSLIFAGKRGGYSEKEMFRVSNPQMVVKFLTVLQSEMATAVDAIETELLKDI